MNKLVDRKMLADIFGLPVKRKKQRTKTEYEFHTLKCHIQKSDSKWEGWIEGRDSMIVVSERKCDLLEELENECQRVIESKNE